jgi:hypothetical protein
MYKIPEWKPLEVVNDIGIDFDQTISNTSGYPSYTPGEPINGVKEAMLTMKNLGYNIVVFTARPWSDKHNIKEYCDWWELPVDDIICGKPLLRCMIDDKAIGFRGNWAESMKEVLTFND